MIVEFLGVSGVGKTTIARKIYGELQEKGIEVEWPWNNLYTDKSWLVRNIFKAIPVVKLNFKQPMWCIKLYKFLRSQGLEKKNIVQMYFNGCYLKYSLSCEKKSEVVLYDEGVLQYFWAVYLRNNMLPNKDKLQAVIDMFGSPDRLYVIQASAEKIYERIVGRGEADEILKNKNVIDKINHMLEVQDMIVGILCDAENGFCVEIEKINNN